LHVSANINVELEPQKNLFTIKPFITVTHQVEL